MTVTLKDIAEKCGVSKITVSDILNNKPKPYAEATKKRIRKVAAEMGYRPNAAARAMSRKRIGRIGLLNHTFDRLSYFPQAMAEGLMEQSQKHKFELSLSSCDDNDFAQADFIPEVLKEWGVDGVLVNINNRSNPKLSELLDHHRVPAIWINTKREFNCICPNDYQAGMDLTCHILSKGFKSISYLSAAPSKPMYHYSRDERAQGYRTAMQNAGLQPQELFVPLRGGKEQMVAQVLKKNSRNNNVQVWIVYSSIEYEYIISCASAYTNLRLGHDYLLAKFSEKKGEEFLCLASAKHPMRKLAKQAIDMLVERIDSDKELAARSVDWEIQDGFYEFRGQGTGVNDT